MKNQLYEKITALLPEAEIVKNEPMSRHTTFRVGGLADIFIKVSNIGQLQILIPELVKTEVSYYVIGKGSNLLVGDRGFRGVMIQLDETFDDVSIHNNTVTAGAGASMAKVAKAAWQNGLSGFEFAAGIPGTIGGGVIMNAGAYGGEMKDVVSKVRCMNSVGEIKEFNVEEMQFGYRNSILKNKPEYIVVEVEINLQQGNCNEILEIMQELAKRRKEKQPLEYPSAGSTFKRPEGHFAGKLISDAGLSGFAVGGAEVSEKHNGFVINKGDATAKDIKELISLVQKKVHETFQVELEPEVIFLGEF